MRRNLGLAMKWGIPALLAGGAVAWGLNAWNNRNKYAAFRNSNLTNRSVNCTYTAKDSSLKGAIAARIDNMGQFDTLNKVCTNAVRSYLTDNAAFYSNTSMSQMARNPNLYTVGATNAKGEPLNLTLTPDEMFQTNESRSRGKNQPLYPSNTLGEPVIQASPQPSPSEASRKPN
jgi:hypothetical protein